jgi:hypothetical protein
MKTQVYLIGSSVVFFSYNPVGPVVLFLRSVPSALLTIDNAPSAGYVTFSQIDNTAGLPAPFLTALFTDIVDAVGANYVSITTMIAAITPAAGGGGGGGSAPDIATYELNADRNNDNYLVRTLTVFDPVTNAPTRSFFELDGVTPYLADPADIVPLSALMPEITVDVDNIQADIAAIRNGLNMNAANTNYQQLSAKNRAAGTFVIPAGARKIQIIATLGTFLAGGITYPFATAGGGLVESYNSEATPGRRLNTLTYTVNPGSTAIEFILGD